MKIFLLRHEDRTQDPTMFSPLTEDGLKNSLYLVNILKKLKVDTIYSSPYVRTLQTIYPYACAIDKMIKIDYSIVEIQHPDLISPRAANSALPEYMQKMFSSRVDSSSINPEEVKYPEDIKDVYNRVKIFLSKLINNYYKTNKCIVIVTHQAVCNSIIKIIKKRGSTILDKSKELNYPTGALTEIFKNYNWTFKPVNWEYESKI